jgi:hypothetical protein
MQNMKYIDVEDMSWDERCKWDEENRINDLECEIEDLQSEIKDLKSNTKFIWMIIFGNIIWCLSEYSLYWLLIIGVWIFIGWAIFDSIKDNKIHEKTIST